MNATRVEVKEAVRWKLRDFDQGDETWEDQEIDAGIDMALRDINHREAQMQHTLLAIQDLSKSIDISGLTNLIDIISVEWPFGEVPIAYRSFRVIGDALILEISSVRDTDEDTLTGTVTFTDGSFAISGSGTAFTTELSAGCYIKMSSGTYWYRVAYVSSDTALVLDTPVDETGGADTEDATLSRTKNDCAMVNWTRPYTLYEDTASELPQRIENVLVMGAVAHCLTAQATRYANEVPIGVGAVNNYIGLADRARNLYEDQLASLGRIEDTMTASYPIT